MDIVIINDGIFADSRVINHTLEEALLPYPKSITPNYIATEGEGVDEITRHWAERHDKQVEIVAEDTDWSRYDEIDKKIIRAKFLVQRADLIVYASLQPAQDALRIREYSIQSSQETQFIMYEPEDIREYSIIINNGRAEYLLDAPFSGLLEVGQEVWVGDQPLYVHHINEAERTVWIGRPLMYTFRVEDTQGEGTIKTDRDGIIGDGSNGFQNLVGKTFKEAIAHYRDLNEKFNYQKVEE